MFFFKKLASTLLAVTLLASPIFSAKAWSQQPARDKLVFVNYRDIRDLNPHLYGGEMFAQYIIYDRLVTITKEGYAPALAESWTISEDGTVYTFKIREGVTFHDGEVCDAYAIQANFNALIENKKRHTWLEMMRLLVSAKATGKYSFEIVMEKPYYPMLTELGVTRPFGMISPKAMKNGSTKDGVTKFIGTGPYILDKFVTDEYAIFKANEKYWGGAPEIKEILVKVIPDNQTRILALEKGEIDLIFGKNMLDADAINKYVDSKKFNVKLSAPTSTRHILMNTTHEILKDIEVRKAIQHATNREAISKGIFYGLEQPAERLYSKTVPYCNIELKPFTYDMKRAASILENSGWKLNGKVREKNGKKLELTLRYNSDSVTEKNIAEYLQSQYRKVGIKINIKGEEEQSYRDNMKSGEFDMVFNISWGMPYDPQSSLAAMRYPVYGDFAAQKGLEDKAQIDQAITDIMTSVDTQKRQQLFAKVLTSLHDDAVYLPLTFECNKALFTKDLKNVDFTPSQYEVPFQRMTF